MLLLWHLKVTAKLAQLLKHLFQSMSNSKAFSKMISMLWALHPGILIYETTADASDEAAFITLAHTHTETVPSASKVQNSWMSKRQWGNHCLAALCMAHSYRVWGTLRIQMVLSSLCNLLCKLYLPGTSSPARPHDTASSSRKVLYSADGQLWRKWMKD